MLLVRVYKELAGKSHNDSFPGIRLLKKLQTCFFLSVTTWLLVFMVAIIVRLLVFNAEMKM